MDWGIVANQGTPIVNQPVLTTAFAITTIQTSGARYLTVLLKLRATVTVGDMAVVGAQAYWPDGVTLSGSLSVANDSTTTVSGADLVRTLSYDLRGIQRISFFVQNANAGTKNLDIGYFCI